MRLMLLVLCAGLVSGCAGSLVGGQARIYGVKDPAEGANQRSYQVAEALDRGVLRPVAGGYRRVVPQVLRTGVSNFFMNLRGLDSALNGFLQGKPRRGLTDVSRVLLNTTLGLGGLFDPASRAGLAFQDEDFGQTLAVWGYSDTAYIYLPVVGPTTVRDLPALAFGFLWPRYLLGDRYNAGAVGLDLISRRAEALNLTDARDASALSPYVFTREAYYQRRRFQIYDGAPPVTDRFEEFEELDELDDE